jgi:hypothetical protein
MDREQTPGREGRSKRPLDPASLPPNQHQEEERMEAHPHLKSEVGSVATSTETQAKSSEAAHAMKRKINLVLQGKGGVGKSWVSSCLVQYFQEAGEPVVALDTDPVNATLSNIKALNAAHVPLLEDNVINERRFDSIIERVLTEDSHFVIDNGASTFLPLSNYLLENPVFDLLADAGRDLVIHTVITGGQAFLDTAFGFNDLAREMPQSVGFVVWLNEYFGPVQSEDGTPFEATRAYIEHKDRITGMVRLPKQSSATFGEDLAAMLRHKWTFKEAVSSQEFSLMARQRLVMIRRGIFGQLAKVV